MNIQDYLTCVGVPLDNTRVPNANDPSDGERCFRFVFGAYGSTRVDVFADHAEDAFEVATEWLDDNAPGYLVAVGLTELKEAAQELGLSLPISAAGETWDDSPEFERILAKAEEGLTPISHTTLKHGSYLVSHEWDFSELTP